MTDDPLARLSSASEILVVDLDGTLIKTDLLIEALCQMAGHNLPRTLGLLWHNFSRPQVVKDGAFAEVTIDPATLPYNTALVDWLRGQAAAGARVYLASASPQGVVSAVAGHLGFFTAAFGSTAEVNLKGAAKLAAIRGLIGAAPFTYIGDSAADLPIWADSAGIGTVNLAPKLVRRLEGRSRQSFDFDQSRGSDLLAAMRPQQWVKNLLIFLPILAAHRWGEGVLLMQALVAFVAFSMCASAVYLINDLLDIEDDRHHPGKHRRPVASGRLHPKAAAVAALGLLLASSEITYWLDPALFLPLGAYIAATFAYSLWIKAEVGIDVVWLAGLYTLRVLAGAVATGIVTSTWLLSFCLFQFLSLACAKRCAELVMQFASNRPVISRRAYQPSDLEIMSTIGVANGFSAVIVLIIYLQDAATRTLYHQPNLLLLVCVLLLYWQAHLWITVRRNEMHSDPIVFALTERRSQLVGVFMMLAFLAAAVL